MFFEVKMQQDRGHSYNYKLNFKKQQKQRFYKKTNRKQGVS